LQAFSLSIASWFPPTIESLRLGQKFVWVPFELPVTILTSQLRLRRVSGVANGLADGAMLSNEN